MSAIQEFIDAYYKEREKDNRPIVGARVSASFRELLSEEGRRNTKMADDPKAKEKYIVRQVIGIPIYLGMVDKLQFDH